MMRQMPVFFSRIGSRASAAALLRELASSGCPTTQDRRTLDCSTIGWWVSSISSTAGHMSRVMPLVVSVLLDGAKPDQRPIHCLKASGVKSKTSQASVNDIW